MMHNMQHQYVERDTGRLCTERLCSDRFMQFLYLTPPPGPPLHASLQCAPGVSGYPQAALAWASSSQLFSRSHILMCVHTLRQPHNDTHTHTHTVTHSHTHYRSTSSVTHVPAFGPRNGIPEPF